MKRAAPGRATRDTERQRQNHHSTAFRVMYQKASGTMREHSRHADRAEADRVAVLLRWAGAVARVEAAP